MAKKYKLHLQNLVKKTFSYGVQNNSSQSLSHAAPGKALQSLLSSIFYSSTLVDFRVIDQFFEIDAQNAQFFPPLQLK